jgi:hypothetical protein
MQEQAGKIKQNNATYRKISVAFLIELVAGGPPFVNESNS